MPVVENHLPEIGTREGGCLFQVYYLLKGRLVMKLLLAICLLLAATPVFAVDPPATEEQKTLYAIGQTVSRQLAVFSLSPDEFQYVLLGLTDAQSGKKPAIDASAYSLKVQELARDRRKALGARLAPLGDQTLSKAAKEPGAVKTASGMVYQSLKEGTGASPLESDTVRVHYRGTLVDGKEFDSSYKRGKPLDLKLSGVIKCWTEGVQKMKVGGKARLVCPPALAYGEQGAGEVIPPQATLQFNVELLDIVNKK
jgi:FKBP-type peptidyl-prolyl cis-trans isomerase FkpA